MSSIYPENTRRQNFHRHVLFLLTCGKERNDVNLDVWRLALDITNNPCKDHPWMMSLMLQSWSVNSNRIALINKWAKGCKEIVSKFGASYAACGNVIVLRILYNSL